MKIQIILCSVVVMLGFYGCASKTFVAQKLNDQEKHLQQDLPVMVDTLLMADRQKLSSLSEQLEQLSQNETRLNDKIDALADLQITVVAMQTRISVLDSLRVGDGKRLNLTEEQLAQLTDNYSRLTFQINTLLDLQAELQKLQGKMDSLPAETLRELNLIISDYLDEMDQPLHQPDSELPAGADN